MPASVSDLNRIVYSDDYRVDALLDGPVVWNFWLDGRNVLYYTFDVSAGSLIEQKTPQGVLAFNAAQQQATRLVLQHAAAVTGIVFTEVSSSALADVHFAASDLAGSATAGLASSFYGYRYQGDGVLTQLEAESLVFLDNVEHAGINSQPVAGDAGYEVLLHEVGHMLGLAHPFESPRPLPADQDHTDNTVMSYTSRGGSKAVFQSYDLLALDWIYGRDGLGGAWGINSTHGPTLVFSHPGPKQVVGTSASDAFVSTSANESFDGAGGLDSVRFAGNRAEYTLTRLAGHWQLSDTVPQRDGVDILAQVERLQFADHAVALDLDGAAGTAARLLGAVLGAQAVGHRDWLGLVLDVVDTGLADRQLARLALDVVFGPSATSSQIVDQLYANLFNRPPDAGMSGALTALLDSGAYSREDLLLIAAASDANAANIDLVGLAARGVEYLPSGM